MPDIIVTVEFEYGGADGASWVEARLQEEFGAVRDVRVVRVRPAVLNVEQIRVCEVKAHRDPSVVV